MSTVKVPFTITLVDDSGVGSQSLGLSGSNLPTNSADGAGNDWNAPLCRAGPSSPWNTASYLRTPIGSNPYTFYNVPQTGTGECVAKVVVATATEASHVPSGSTIDSINLEFDLTTNGAWSSSAFATCVAMFFDDGSTVKWFVPRFATADIHPGGEYNSREALNVPGSWGGGTKSVTIYPRSDIATNTWADASVGVPTRSSPTLNTHISDAIINGTGARKWGAIFQMNCGIEGQTSVPELYLDIAGFTVNYTGGTPPTPPTNPRIIQMV